MDQLGRSDDHSARVELARTVKEVDDLTEWRLTLPGGGGDAALRDQVEALQAKANRLCLELGEPQRYPATKTHSGRRGWMGWAVIALVVIAVVLVLWAVS